MFIYKNNNLHPILLNKHRINDNGQTILFTNARDEPNISEWVAHHLLLGFDKIIVFDHLSTVPISSMIKTNFNGRLNIIRVYGIGNIKVSLMKQAIDIASKGNYSWMLYLDADEFLNLNKFANIKSFLGDFKEADAIGINWLMFGTSGHKEQPKGLITEKFIRSEIRLNKHVKSFVRPSVAIRVNNPHYFIITNSNRYFSANGTKMSIGPFNNQPLSFIKSPIYIAHFYTQSEEEHLRRKSRQMDDGSLNKEGHLPEVHNFYNDVVNNQLQNKYSQRTKQFLKDYGIEI
jgi:hypothetical protein